jgi:predicted transcriptional regulator
MTVRLTRRELDLMSVLWHRGSGTVAEVLEDVADDISYSTVMTLMRTMEAKGLVRHEKEGKAFRFFPEVEADEAGESALGRILDKIFHGSRELLVHRLVDKEDVSADELRRIQAYLEARLKELEE